MNKAQAVADDQMKRYKAMSTHNAVEQRYVAHLIRLLSAQSEARTQTMWDEIAVLLGFLHSEDATAQGFTLTIDYEHSLVRAKNTT